MQNYVQTKVSPEQIAEEAANAMLTFAFMQKNGCKYSDNNSSYVIVDNCIRVKQTKNGKSVFYSADISMETLTRYFTFIHYDDDFLNEEEKADKELGMFIKKYVDACAIMLN